MGHSSVKLHDFSLCRMWHLMCGLLMVPPSPQLHLKLLYNMAVLAYLIMITRWRFAFQYQTNYDYLHDHLSRIIDLTNFLAMIVGHLIVSMELIWNNRSVHIDQQFRQMQHILQEKLGYKVNLSTIQLYSNIIYGFLIVRVTSLLTTTMYSYITTCTSLLMLWNFYSEIVLILRCCEFTLHSALVLSIYRELLSAGSKVFSELDIENRSMSLHKIQVFQELHRLLWQTQRDIESNFEQSLIVIMMKNFVDISVIPYWLYLTRNHVVVALNTWCVSEEIGKLLEICIPCWICTRCDHLQREFRSLFHGVSKNRRNEELNTTLLRISTQLGQERCHFRIGGLITINYDMLGKFLFGVVSYIFICIQFRINFIDAAEREMLLNNQSEISYLIDAKT